MAIVFDIVDQECRKREFFEPLYISANWSIHHQKLCESWRLIDSVEDGRSSLRVSKHCKVAFIAECLQDLFEKLQWERPHGFLSSFRLAVTWTVDGDDVELFKVGHSHQVLMEEVGVLC